MAALICPGQRFVEIDYETRTNAGVTARTCGDGNLAQPVARDRRRTHGNVREARLPRWQTCFMPTDARFDVPLYSVTEAARYLDVPVSTFRTWVHGYERRPEGRRPVTGAPIVTTLPRDAGVSVPFIGLAEAYALAAIRSAGVPLQRIRNVLDLLQQELGIEHVLASRSLYTDGAELLYDFAEREGDSPEARSARDLVVVRDGQRVFNEVVESFLRRVEFAGDGWAERIHLRKYGNADVVVDPRRSFGIPIFARGAVRLETVISAFKAGTDIDCLTAEYGVPRDDLLSVLRVHTEAA